MSKSKHRGNPRPRLPLSVIIYSAKNQWHYFTKPALKLKTLRLANKTLALVTRFLTRWPK